MNKIATSKLFKEPAIWPAIPPWWLVSSTEAAALLNVKPASLHTWRVRGFGPPVFPPMYIRPTQGNPLYYQYGALRTWAASKLGMAYRFDDQCMDFFGEIIPGLTTGSGSVSARAKTFEFLLKEARKLARQGKQTGILSLNVVQSLDVNYSKQPVLNNGGESQRFLEQF